MESLAIRRGFVLFTRAVHGLPFVIGTAACLGAADLLIYGKYAQPPEFTSTQKAHRIELKVKDIDQLFLTYDPNPFFAKQLDSAAEVSYLKLAWLYLMLFFFLQKNQEFIKYYAEMENEGERFELVIRCEEDWCHGNSRFTAEDVRDAIRANFLRYPSLFLCLN